MILDSVATLSNIVEAKKAEADRTSHYEEQDPKYANPNALSRRSNH